MVVAPGVMVWYPTAFIPGEATMAKAGSASKPKGAEAVKAPADAPRVDDVRSKKVPNCRRGLGESISSPRRIAARYRQADALELRKQGYSYRDIGEQLGCTTQNAFLSVKAAMDRITEEPAADLIRLECERLDALYSVAHSKAMNLDAARMMAEEEDRIAAGGKPLNKREKEQFRRIIQANVAEQLAALDSCMKVMQRRAKLLGLDKPEKHEHGGPGGTPLAGGVLLVPGMTASATEWAKDAAEYTSQRQAAAVAKDASAEKPA